VKRRRKMKGRKKVLVISAAVLATGLILVGCTTIMHGTSQDIGISSTPSGALVSIDNKSFGKTPLFAKLSRKDNHLVKIEMAGYQPFEATITRSVSGWVWGNVLFGGLIGLAVDGISGGLYKLSPEQIVATLGKEGIGLLHQKDVICVAVVLKPDPSWQRIATLKPLSVE
jgi:dipeptide/tripeptide permease